MKVYPIILFLAACLCGRAAEVAFEWNASPSTNVTGYRLYLNTNAHFDAVAKTNASVVLTSGTTNATWTGAPAGVDCWGFCTATNEVGLESDPSNTIRFSVPLPPATLRVKMALFQSGSIDGPWQPVNAPCWEFETPMTTNQAFYRGLVQIDRP